MRARGTITQTQNIMGMTVTRAGKIIVVRCSLACSLESDTLIDAQNCRVSRSLAKAALHPSATKPRQNRDKTAHHPMATLRTLVPNHVRESASSTSSWQPNVTNRSESTCESDRSIEMAAKASGLVQGASPTRAPLTQKRTFCAWKSTAHDTRSPSR